MSGPLGNQPWDRLTFMAITGEGDTEDPSMDAIVELGHRAERVEQLEQDLRLLLDSFGTRVLHMSFHKAKEARVEVERLAAIERRLASTRLEK